MRLLVAVATVGLLAGCSGALRDRSMDYAKATTTPPLPVTGATRPIKPLLDVPAVAQPFDASKPFVVPYPPALKLTEAVAELAPLPDSNGRLPVKLGTDGNGIPELRVVGPRERVWDELAKALAAAEVKVKDRNQSLGIVDVEIADQPYQVRMIRATDAFVINIQRNDESLAPVGIARNLLSTLQVRWP